MTRTRHFFLTALAGLFLLSPAAIADEGMRWRIVAGEESYLRFEGTQMGAPFTGHFKQFDGTILFDPERLSDSRVDITIDLSSVDAGSPDRTRYLPMADWFNTAQFPNARFVSTRIEKGLDLNEYVAHGALTLRDVTASVILPFTLKFEEADNGTRQAQMQGTTSINRLDYGVGQGQWRDTKSVGADVRIDIGLIAERN